MLFDVKQVDRSFYEERLADFLPQKLIDIHTHIGLKAHRRGAAGARGTVTWPERVAAQNPVEDLLESYRLLFPGKEVLPLVFAMTISPGDDLAMGNEYVGRCAARFGLPALVFAAPSWGAGEFEERVMEGGFLGAKVYLTWSDPAIPAPAVRIFDFLPRHQLEVLDRHGWAAMLHVPRPARLRDPENLVQIIEIEREYPKVKLILAHVGRAYCPQDLGNAFEVLSETRRVRFDISANTNVEVFAALIRSVGAGRILFGSDLPITRMRMRRVCQGGVYVNLVPANLYGDISGDRNMREVSPTEAGTLTFFLYEEIDAFRRAAKQAGLTAEDIHSVFYGNAADLLAELGVPPPSSPFPARS